MTTITKTTELSFEQSKGNFFNSYNAEGNTHRYRIVKMHGDCEYTAQCIDKETEKCVSETFRSMPSAFQYCNKHNVENSEEE